MPGSKGDAWTSVKGPGSPRQPRQGSSPSAAGRFAGADARRLVLMETEFGGPIGRAR